MTVRPRLFVLSLSQAKNRVTGRVIKRPIVVNAFASIREKPRDMTMLGVYVVSGLHVAKTQAVARKWGHFWTFANVFHTILRGIC